MKYRPDIDGLRTVAVLLVLVFHFDLFALGKAGFIGVDVFFVISGFLITAIIRADLEADRFRFGMFLYRRIRRLYPALMATLILTLLAGWVLFLPHRFAELASQTFWSLAYVVNFYFWQNISYFGLQAGAVPLLHMWSLAVEEQFYFFFPLVCLGLWRFARAWLLPAVVAGMLASFVLGVVMTPLKPEAAFYLLPTRAWELMLGATLALLVHGRTPRGVWLQFMGPLGVVLILASVVLYSPVTAVPGWFALLPTLGAGALILGGYAPRAPVTRVLSTPLMVWIGRISYPLYLVHWPIRIFLQEHTLEFTLEWRIAGFVASFLCATAIYICIETPIRRGKVLAGRRLYTSVVVGLSVVTLLASAVIWRSEGVPSRFSPQVAALLDTRDDRPLARQNCTLRGTTIADLCPLGDPGAVPEVLVIGDSHALAFSGAFDLWLRQTGRGGALAFHHGCMPVLQSGQNRCRQATQATLARAIETPGITDVILVSIWRQAVPNGGRPFEGRWVPQAQVAQVFAKHLADTVAQLEAAGKRVTLVDPFFKAANFVPETLASNVVFGRNWPVDTPLEDHMAVFETVHGSLEAVTGPNVKRLSLIAPFCAQGLCRAVVEDTPLFTDDNHLAFSHSSRIADILAQRTPALWAPETTTDETCPKDGPNIRIGHHETYCH